MQTQFHIKGKQKYYPADCTLAIILSENYFTYAITDTERNELVMLKRYKFASLDTGILDVILSSNPEIDANFHKIITGLNFNTNQLLPVELSGGDATPLMYLNDVNQQDHVITEHIRGVGVANIYALPNNALTWMVHNFPSSGYMHIHTVLVENLNKGAGNGILHINIDEKNFSVAVMRNNDLLLAKTFNYHAPADVAFYLLKICETYNLKQEDVLIEVTGLVEEGSKLYKELYDYFLNINLKPTTWVDDTATYPAHYFTLVNQLAQCELLQEV